MKVRYPKVGEIWFWEEPSPLLHSSEFVFARIVPEEIASSPYASKDFGFLPLLYHNGHHTHCILKGCWERNYLRGQLIYIGKY